MKPKPFLSLFLFCLLSNAAFGLGSNTGAISTGFSDEPEFLPVEEAYKLSVDTLTSGNSKELLLNWEIAPGYYLYQDKTRLKSPSDKTIPLEMPEGIVKYDEYFEKDLTVYYGNLSIAVVIDEFPGSYRLQTQGCADAGLCYPPQWQTIEIDSSGNASVAGSDSPFSGSGSTGIGENTGTAQSSFYGLLISLISALIGGLILNLMPCVFPVLSLKALSFANSRHSTHEHHLHGWAYTLGTVSTFVAIASILFVLRSSGELIGWGFQLQNPLVVGALVYLFFFMGLLLFGNYHFGSSLAGIGQSLTEGQSLRASFFTGSLATIVASPCTAPFMGTALGYAFTQPPFTGLLVFGFLGLGMALPFLLLSYFPSLSKALPKPGPWMDKLRQFLAFPLFLTAIWLLWVLGHQAGSDAVILLLMGGVGIVLALWLQQISLSWLAIPVLILSLLPFNYIETATTSEPKALAHGWQPYNSQRLEDLLQSGQPVFVNLTADWCITCLANEKIALDTEATRNALENQGYVKIKGDWTNYNPEITRLLTKHGRSGVPLYLIYAPGHNGTPVILPQILQPGSVIEAISNRNTKDSVAFTENSDT